MNIPFEDTFADILGKAQRGLGISDFDLAEKARINTQKITELRDGDFDELAALRIAPILGLAGRALVDLAKGDWQPQKIELEGLAQFSTRYGEIMVNSYLVWEPKTMEAIAFDTGADCQEKEMNRETDPADARAFGSRRRFETAAPRNWRAGVHFGP
jgi:hypothetical protein